MNHMKKHSFTNAISIILLMLLDNQRIISIIIGFSILRIFVPNHIQASQLPIYLINNINLVQ